MEPALLSGDFILVSKMSFGVRLLKPIKFFKQKKIEFIRTKSWSTIKKGDIFVFNLPEYFKYLDSSETIYGTCLVKRCYALPGDTLVIKKGIGNSIVFKDIGMIGIQGNYNLFPYDSSLHWSLENYGPLYVPAKGQVMELTNQKVIWYRNILRYENPNSHIKNSSLIIDDITISKYTFQHNYYFMLGDNFYNSHDSRYWGFVPDDNVIGKVVLVLFSIDPNEFGFKKFRWSRLLKKI